MGPSTPRTGKLKGSVFNRRDWIVLPFRDPDGDPIYMLVPRGTSHEDMQHFGQRIPVLCTATDREAAANIAAAVNTFTHN